MSKVIAYDQPSGIAESAFVWNPLIMKRSVLGPAPSPSGGYHYYGPPPDVGTSYGSWWDSANNLGVIAPVPHDGVTMYSPASGETMQYEGPANPDALDAVHSYAGEYALMPATRSGHACLTTAAIYGACQVPAIYNPFTGEDVTEEFQVMKTQKEASAKKNEKAVAAAPAAKPQPATAGSATAPGFKGPGSMKTPEWTQPVPSLKSEPNSKLKGLDHSSVDKGKDKMGGGKTGPEGSDEPASSKPMKTVKQSSIKPAGLGSEIKKPDMSGLQKPASAMTDDELVAALEQHLAQADGEMPMSLPPAGGAPKLEIEIGDGLNDPFGEEDPNGEAAMPLVPGAEPVDPMGAGLPPVGGEEPVVPVIEEEGGFGEEPQLPMASASAGLVRKMRAMAAALRAGITVDPKEQAALERAAITALRNRKTAAATKTEEETFLEFVKTRSVDPATAAMMKALKDLTGTVAQLAQKVEKIGKPVKAEGLEDELSGMPPPPPPASSAPVDPSAPLDPSALPPPPPAPPAQDGSGMPPPAAMPPAVTPEGSEEQKVEEIMSTEPAEGVHFEVLQSMDELEKEGITASNITGMLYAEGGVNPFWNISVCGEPLARVYLQDQERPDEIKAVFCSPTYIEAIAKSSEQIEGGLRRCLEQANAKFFATQMDHSEIAQRAAEQANATAKKVVAERLSTLSDKYTECLATAAIGYDRNFFKGGNPLKSAFAEVLQQHGMSVNQAVQVIEAAFADGSAEYFKVLAKRANHLMSMDPAAFDDLRGAILEAGVVMPSVEEDPNAGVATASVDSGKSFSQHLTENSNRMQATAMTALASSERLTEHEVIRRDMNFSRNRG